MRKNIALGRRTFLNGAMALALTASLSAAAFGLAGCGTAEGDSAAPEQSAPEQPAGSTEESAAKPSDSAASDTVAADQTFVQVAATFDVSALDLEYSKRDLDAGYDAASAVKVTLADGGSSAAGKGVEVSGDVVTISEEGTYLVSGKLTDGHLVVDAPDTAKVQMVLDGADVSCSNGPALYVKSADKVFVTLVDGSKNSLADGETYAADAEDEPYGALFSKDDLTINGKGSLAVTGAHENGIVSKDDLVITGGTITVDAVADGLRGKDCVKIADGDISVNAGGDAIKSNNDSDATRGFVSIDGGTIAATAGDKAVKAEFFVRVAGGTLDLVAADDAIHSNLEVLISGGDTTIDAGDDAVHGETKLVVDGGTVDVRSCVEGLEAQQVIVNDGDVFVEASDDALNAAVADLSDDDAAVTSGGTASAGQSGAMGAPAGQQTVADEQPGSTGQTPQGRQGRGGSQAPDGANGQMPEPPSGFGGGEVPEGAQAPDGQMPDFGGRGGMGGGMAQSSSECLIQINGGRVVFNAGNDGLDSNGNVEINGGIVLGCGPSSGMDGALDYDLSGVVRGGTFILLGSVGNTSGLDQSTHPFVSAQVSGNAGDAVALTDANREVLASLTAGQRFAGIMASSENMESGQTYQLVVGGSVTGADAYGYASGGKVSGGSSTDVTAGTSAPAGAMGAMGGRGMGAGKAGRF